MGRHGGGSRSGGGGSRSSSRSGSGSRSSGVRTSRKPFSGSYNRTYYTRSGRCVKYYTTNKYFGVREPKFWHILIPLIPVLITMTVMVLILGTTVGHKVQGDINRIMIIDDLDLLSDVDEVEIVSLFKEVYSESGMPITLVIKDYSICNYYASLEYLSEELYYQISQDEDACLILFLLDTDNPHPNGWYDWKYDVYCGDDTVPCFSDELFDKFLDEFQSGLATQDLNKALHIGWESVMRDMAKTSFNPVVVIVLIPMFLHVVIIVSIVHLPRYLKERTAYLYFKEHPEMLEGVRRVIKKKCPNCNASNSEGKDNCAYCGTLLTEVKGNVEYV